MISHSRRLVKATTFQISDPFEQYQRHIPKLSSLQLTSQFSAIPQYIITERIGSLQFFTTLFALLSRFLTTIVPSAPLHAGATQFLFLRELVVLWRSIFVVHSCYILRSYDVIMFNKCLTYLRYLVDVLVCVRHICTSK